MPINHLGIPVSDLSASRAFYEAALGPLGMAVRTDMGEALGFGAEGEQGLFWIGAGEGDRPGTGLHVAFDAESHAQVDAFYNAALAAGGKDNGPPGPRPNYGPNYYAAFVFDPDGANIEAVCDQPV